MVPTFRRAVMWADDGKEPNPSSNYRYSCEDDNLLHQLQEMYTYLTFSEKMDYNPRGFCYSFKDFDGNPINIAAQQDSQEFLNNFCDKIENSLKPTKFKNIVADVFTGSTCSSVLCDKCKHISNRFEDFYTLTLEVKNINTLNDSLHKLSVPEIIDDFKCSNCNQNVRISKITSLNKLPNVLIIHLKRFYLDYETCHTTKINSKLEFPRKINLKEFCIEEITKNYSISQDSSIDDIYSKEDEYYQYDLKGINIHTGSADGGHYFSFIDTFRDGTDNIMNTQKQGKNDWLIFNDSNVSEFDTDKIASEAYGGNTEGYSFENCQNAYLLFYERKKKAPIRILLDENEKKNLDLNNNEKIVKVNKENINKIKKEYDLSRIGNTLEEKTLYEKIFYDEDKQEYYKYIPYYNIPKYAPKKYYNEVMKDNHKKPENKIGNKLNKQLLKKYKSILIKKSKEVDFRKDEIKSDSDKQCVLSIILQDYMQDIKNNNSIDNNDIRKINEEFEFIDEKLIQPLLNDDTDISLLKVINENIGDEDNMNKIFCYSTGYFSKDKTLLTYENCEKYMQNLEKLVVIFYKKNSYLNYREELERTIKSLFSLIKSSKSKKQSVMSYGDDNEESEDNRNSKEGIIFAFKLLYKLAKEYDQILKALIDTDIIDTLITKISDHIQPIREIIYDCLLYVIKQTDEYNKKLFDLSEGETEGKIRINPYSIYSRNNIKGNQTTKLFEEKPELLKILFVIISNNNENNMKEINQFIDQLFHKYEDNPEKIYTLVDLISTLIQINDQNTYDRLIQLAGYPSLVVRPIPKEEKDEFNNNSSNSNSDNEDNDNKEEKRKTEVKQKWPLFGERLIDGDINKEIYEYVLSNHKKSNRCLLSILFPSQYVLEKEEKEYDDDDNNKYKTIKIPEEKKKEILLNLLRSIFGERNNYPLFKYLYLIPARSLLYKNLYSEIVKFTEIWTSPQSLYPIEQMKKKEQEYKELIEKEVKMVIDSALKKDNKDSNHYGINYYHRDSDDFELEDDLYEDKIFECKDKKMKNFTGFIGEIIPGEIIREEIFGIARNAALAMYRIHYYTKYYQLDELRDRLLNPEKYKKEDEEDDKKSVKSKDSKSSNSSKKSKSSNSSKKSKSSNSSKKSKSSNSSKKSKSSNSSKKSKSSSSNKSKENEEEKKEEEKEEQLDKGDEEKKEEDNENKDENKDEDTKKEDEENKEEENDEKKTEEEKKEEEKPEEENNEEKKTDEENKEEEKPKEEENNDEKIKEEEKKEEEKSKEEENSEKKTEEENKNDEQPKEEKKEAEPKQNENNEEKKVEEENEEKKKEEKEEEKKDEEKKDEEKEEEGKKEEKKEEEKEEEEKKQEKSEEEITEEDINERGLKYKQGEKSDDEEEKKNEEEKEKSDDEEEKKERKSNSSKSNKSEDKEKEEEKEKEKEKEEEENIITEINPDLEERASAVKYDVSEKNENSFIYRIYNEEKDIFILEDKSKKDKNNVRCLVCRYIFANSDPRKKIFHATIKKQRDLKSQTKKNCLIVDEVKDNVLPHQNTCFMILQRFRDNLEFIKKDDIVISIGFDQN